MKAHLLLLFPITLFFSSCEKPSTPVEEFFSEVNEEHAETLKSKPNAEEPLSSADKEEAETLERAETPAPAGMTGARLERQIKKLIKEKVSAQGNVITFSIRGVEMMCVYDETADRMRIISPIIEASEVTHGQAQAMMEANFHRALDARYATSNGIVYAAFIHPLSTLHPSDLQSVIYQVYSARVSFGTEYTSGLLNFGGDTPGAEEEGDPSEGDSPPSEIR